MKKLGRKPAAYRELLTHLRQELGAWPEMDADTRARLCALFLLQDELKKGKAPTADSLSQVMPAATDFARQATTLAENQPEAFTSVRNLLEDTQALFVWDNNSTSGCSCC